jgi:hypothetical protein
MSEQDKAGPAHGGGPQGERIEGSLTNMRAEDRTFDVDRIPMSAPGHTGPQGEGGVAGAGTGSAGLASTASATDAMGGLSGDAGAGPGASGGGGSPQIFEGQGEDPGSLDTPGEEHSGYGNTPPR